MQEPDIEIIDEFITTADVKRMFGKSGLTINHWRDNFGLPYVRIPGDGRDTIRYREERVKAWARKHGKKINGEEPEKSSGRRVPGRARL